MPDDDAATTPDDDAATTPDDDAATTPDHDDAATTPDHDDAFTAAFDALQPTQYCLSAAKLRGAMAWFDFDDPEYDPVEVARVENRGEADDEDDDEDEARLLLLDGHSRAFCALLAGEPAVRAIDVTDDVDRDVYLTCREWCVERDVESVRDLVGEVWSATRYEDDWLARCEDAFGEN